MAQELGCGGFVPQLAGGAETTAAGFWQCMAKKSTAEERQSIREHWAAELSLAPRAKLSTKEARPECARMIRTAIRAQSRLCGGRGMRPACADQLCGEPSVQPVHRAVLAWTKSWAMRRQMCNRTLSVRVRLQKLHAEIVRVLMWGSAAWHLKRTRSVQ